MGRYILESIVKYLKENVGLKNKIIGELLNRNVQIVWRAYHSSRKKYSKKLGVKGENIPISVFSNRKLSVMENLVVYLKQRGMKYSEIARLISRDERTVWTVYKRAMKKNEK